MSESQGKEKTSWVRPGFDVAVSALAYMGMFILFIEAFHPSFEEDILLWQQLSDTVSALDEYAPLWRPVLYTASAIAIMHKMK